MRLLTLATLMSLSAGAVALAQTTSPSSTPSTTTTATPAASAPSGASTSSGTAAQDPAKPAAKSSSDDATIAAEHSANADADKIIEPKGDASKTDDKNAKKSKDGKTDTADSKKDDDIPNPGDHLDPHIKKGSEDDVNAIGTRNIGGRGMGNWYSTNWEIGTGKQYSMEVEKSSHLVTDPVVVEYVNRVGQNLVKNSDAKVPFTIKVLDTDEINAMALPGGYFYVNSGLILACDSEDELAGVMAHEISHVVAHHAAREMTRLNYMQIGSIPLMIFTQGTWTGYGIYEATQLAVPMAFLSFSRQFEAEADFLGVQWMYKAGYDPQGMVTIFEKLSALEKHKPGALSKAFSDHPATPDRIANVEDEIATILPARPEYLVTTSEFDQVKARLARIQNKRGVNDKKNGNKPTLRRTGTSNNDPNSTNSNSNDGPPTLGRRN
ncbi:M48 family metallopeptidase [Bryocella elongata]|nr:M48 family metallopeptidase [Bryocella elongata]